MGIGARERDKLTSTLLAAGPDAPTLCEGWTARDLAAHVVLRDRRPDAALGMFLKPVAKHLESVNRAYLAEDFSDLVGKVAAGPSISPTRLPVIDNLMNAIEFAVHTEDVRRGGETWEPLPRDPALDNLITSRLRLMRAMLLRKSPATIALATREGTRVGPLDAAVTVTGNPLELLLFCFGRQSAAEVDYAGAPEDVAAVTKASFGI